MLPFEGSLLKHMKLQHTWVESKAQEIVSWDLGTIEPASINDLSIPYLVLALKSREATSRRQCVRASEATPRPLPCGFHAVAAVCQLFSW